MRFKTDETFGGFELSMVLEGHPVDHLKSGPAKNFLLGPTPLPVFGNLLQLDRTNPLKDLDKRYGSLYSLYIGRQPAVVLTGQKVIRETLVTQGVEFAGRPDTMMINHITQSKGVNMTDFEEGWREH
ncbi:cytochrome P450 2B4-like [Myxocyprinus asiaticus]|uniref:cytochrome P450 2B4-like n=1 Tax=Myxocyprinus asiaticus TaxID=70543 RepID=UPI002221AB15|nr:cytochrome P450 2B4-like [Myxocyprinus asiaticus]